MKRFFSKLLFVLAWLFLLFLTFDFIGTVYGQAAPPHIPPQGHIWVPIDAPGGLQWRLMPQASVGQFGLPYPSPFYFPMAPIPGHATIKQYQLKEKTNYEHRSRTYPGTK